METFRYSLKNYQPKIYKSQRILFILLGVIYIVIGAFNIPIHHKNIVTGFISSYVDLVFGIFMTIGGFFVRYSVNKFFIQFNFSGVSASHKKLTVLWGNIKNVHISPLKIEFVLKDGNRKSLPLDMLGYLDVQLIKSKFIEFANTKEIKVE